MANNLFKQVFIKDLKEGDRISGQPFVIKSYRTLTSKNNKQYIDITIGDKTGSMKGKIWSDNLVNCQEGREGDVFLISGNIDSFSNSLQMTITSMFKADEFEVSDFLQVARENPDEMYSQLTQFMAKIEDEDFKDLLETVFDDENIRNTFKKAPAAFTVHHSYAGGLLEHTLDCLVLAESLLERYPKMRKDLLFTGAILHDFGKIFEFDISTTITISDRGKLLGHIYMGTEYISKIAPKGFDQEKLNELMHLLLSHHGELEFGSPIKPKTIEAVALWMADMASAKVNMAYNFTYDNIGIGNDDQNFSPYHKHLATDLYLKPYIAEEDE
ncbi:MAG: HD-superfamily hydrolase [candidate division CPR2 bacterium GW2011_GWC1_39_9]|uniref:HD-superfamily hydrolase n=1 Tax=candidate division CPR2 bacterium GW2011_GWC2_39_10 TaxID=1618345 RepID=A0A0G0P9G4_UNCC2|nr:MAG: HD-superfamily hydrolase [candidate division CPR2 bacterium GW2011_GWC2_39_10]KKR34623.1 MAG: HD-superfamily hydrolase [candidate division CPR2 bacterium GW2011_GWC1_39_9]